jgi:hypothetical protein
MLMHLGIVAAMKADTPAQEAEIGNLGRWPQARGFISSRLAVAFFFLPIACFAAGGTCPSGANYTNPANPTGSLVTLSSLGVTSCYFVSAAGSDSSYDGTQETVSGSHGPFLHSPGMENCSSNCKSAGTPSAGIGVIFRGGDTYHFGNSSATPYAGVVTGCADNGNVAGGLCLDDVTGTSSNPIYYGFDPSWYTGGSWARPVLTADNSPCNASTVGTLPDGATCTGATNTACLASGQSYYSQQCYYVSSCPYQIGGSNNLVDVGFSKYVILDGFELTGLCLNQLGEPTGNNVYVRYGNANAPLYFQNLYIHGLSHLQFGGLVSTSSCTGSNVCCCITTFDGSVTTGSVGETIVFNAIDFSDSDPGAGSFCGGGFYNAAYNAFRYGTDCLAGTLHLFHDNLYEYFYENGHSNVLETADVSGTNAVYNNVFRHIELGVTSGGGVGIWLGPPSSTTDYVFNNLMYDVGAFEYINMGGTPLATAEGNYTFFNNTFQTNASQAIFNCGNYTTGTTTDTNDHFIDDTSQYSLCSHMTSTTALLLSNATASSDGYTSSQTYAYSPIGSGSPTVGQGTTEYSGYCSALSAAGLSAAATACENATPYACTYNTTSHMMTCPAVTVTARPSSGAWDVGAYQFSSAVTGLPQPPTSLLATAQ